MVPSVRLVAASWLEEEGGWRTGAQLVGYGIEMGGSFDLYIQMVIAAAQFGVTDRGDGVPGVDHPARRSVREEDCASS